MLWLFLLFSLVLSVDCLPHLLIYLFTLHVFVAKHKDAKATPARTTHVPKKRQDQLQQPTQTTVGTVSTTTSQPIPLHSGSTVLVNKHELLGIYVPDPAEYTVRLAELVLGRPALCGLQRNSLGGIDETKLQSLISKRKGMIFQRILG